MKKVPKYFNTKVFVFFGIILFSFFFFKNGYATVFIDSTAVGTSASLQIGNGEGAGAYPTSSYPILTGISSTVGTFYMSFKTGSTWTGTCQNDAPFLFGANGAYVAIFNLNSLLPTTTIDQPNTVYNITWNNAGNTFDEFGEWYFANAGADCKLAGVNSGTFTGDRTVHMYPWLYLGDTPYVPPEPTITGNITIASSGYNGPDFTNWVIAITPPTSSISTYYGKISYQAGPTWTFVNNIYSDTFAITTNQTSTIYWPVHKSQSLFNYQNNNGVTSSWSAQLYLSTSTTFSSVTDSSTFIISPFATTSTLSSVIQTNASGTTSTVALNELTGPFFWNAMQPFTGGGTWYTETIASSSAKLYASCTPASDWTDVGGGIAYGICVGWNLITSKTGEFFANTAQTTYSALSKVFPFSIPITFYDNIKVAAQTATTSSASITFTIPSFVPLPTSSRTMTIYSSSNDAPPFQSDWFTMQTYLWQFALVAIIFLTIRHELSH